MARYIDADEFEKQIKPYDTYDHMDKALYNFARNKMSCTPTADVVEVVRCKDCVYAIPYNEKWTLPKKSNCLWCKLYEDIRTPDWFCADGERREDE